MNIKKAPLLAWMLCGIIIVFALVGLGISLANRDVYKNVFVLASAVVLSVSLPITFASVAALIVSRQPRNLIGWLLMCPAFVAASPLESYLKSFPAAPPTLTLPLWLALWFGGWGWLLLIIPILFIPLLFPTGRPPSPRWRWLLFAGLGMCVFFILFATFSQTFQMGDSSVVNPIGFIPTDRAWQYVEAPWGVALLSLTVLCVVSLFIRYRRAQAVERAQIKWLLYACGMFAAVYIPLWWISDLTTVLHDVWSVLFGLVLLGLPISIAIAILRYRLWDIDVIIRRTLVYGGLTATLALVYFGSVVLLQELLQVLTGQHQSPIATVISTLAIAALFTPLRRRIQNDIDRRFYRRKYNAQKTLESFSVSVRDEVELEELSSHLMAVVQETMQPENVSLWLRPFTLTPAPPPNQEEGNKTASEGA